MGRDKLTAMMALRMDSTTWMAVISRFRNSSRRFMKEFSQPKNLTKRTDCRISCVRPTLWSVILLIAFRRTNNPLTALDSRGTPMISRAKPASAL